MKLRTLVTVGLLLFVVAGFVALAMKKGGQANSDQPAENPTVAVATAPSSSEPLTDGVMIYCFHADVRCPTCQKIEAYALETVKTRFAQELDAGTVVWKVLNYEASGNEHFADEYNLVAPTVVVVAYKDGQVVRWDNLMKVWELVSDKPAFADFIGESVQGALDATVSQDSQA